MAHILTLHHFYKEGKTLPLELGWEEGWEEKGYRPWMQSTVSPLITAPTHTPIPHSAAMLSFASQPAQHS